jgi:hypothetical protein
MHSRGRHANTHDDDIRVLVIEEISKVAKELANSVERGRGPK